MQAASQERATGQPMKQRDDAMPFGDEVDGSSNPAGNDFSLWLQHSLRACRSQSLGLARRFFPAWNGSRKIGPSRAEEYAHNYQRSNWNHFVTLQLLCIGI
ncbi:hypothetical protein M1D80_24595 [Phyllobacteriaceae bacterium JZ32]